MKRVFVFIQLFLVFSTVLSASVVTDIKGTMGWTYDTNAFSNPLPQGYPISSGYPNGGEFLQRQNINLGYTADLLFDSSSRVGLSVAMNLGIPFFSKSIVPVGEGYDWEYVVYDSLGKQNVSLYLSAGPSFRFNTGAVDLILPVRMSIGSYDWFTTGIVVGVSIEPEVIVFITDDIFLSFSLSYDAHLMKFFVSMTQVYDPGYIMLTTGAAVGAGVRL